MERRNIAVAIILSIVTCGIYGIYWLYKIAEGFYNTPTQERVETTPGMTVLLMIVTCSVYAIYCYYKWGRATAEIWASHGRKDEDKAILYLLLSIFGFAIVCDALIQNDFNQWVTIAENSQGGQGFPPNQGHPPY